MSQLPEDLPPELAHLIEKRDGSDRRQDAATDPQAFAADTDANAIPERRSGSDRRER